MIATGTLRGRFTLPGTSTPDSGRVLVEAEIDPSRPYVLDPAGHTVIARANDVGLTAGQLAVDLPSWDAATDPTHLTYAVTLWLDSRGGLPPLVLRGVRIDTDTDTWVDQLLPGSPGAPEYALQVSRADFDALSTRVVELEEHGPETGYVHLQTTPAAQWSVFHGLGRYVTPTLLVDSLPGVPVWTDVSFPDPDHALITWPSPESGRATFP